MTIDQILVVFGAVVLVTVAIRGANSALIRDRVSMAAHRRACRSLARAHAATLQSPPAPPRQGRPTMTHDAR